MREKSIDECSTIAFYNYDFVCGVLFDILDYCFSHSNYVEIYSPRFALIEEAIQSHYDMSKLPEYKIVDKLDTNKLIVTDVKTAYSMKLSNVKCFNTASYRTLRYGELLPKKVWVEGLRKFDDFEDCILLQSCWDSCIIRPEELDPSKNYIIYTKTMYLKCIVPYVKRLKCKVINNLCKDFHKRFNSLIVLASRQKNFTPRLVVESRYYGKEVQLIGNDEFVERRIIEPLENFIC